MFFDKEKQVLWNLKSHDVISTTFRQVTLQPTNLQCYSIFLTSLKLTCTKMTNTPKPCDDPAHRSTPGNLPHHKCKMGQGP